MRKQHQNEKKSRQGEDAPVALDDEGVLKNCCWQPRDEASKGLTSNVCIAMDVEIHLKIIRSLVEGMLGARQHRLVVVILHTQASLPFDQHTSEAFRQHEGQQDM